MGKRNGSRFCPASGARTRMRRGVSRVTAKITAIFIAVLSFFALTSPVFATCTGPIHVDIFASGSNNGQTWQDAFIDLQVALDSARACGADTILVAAGTYYPDRSTNNSDSTFRLIDGVVMLGGFPNGGGIRDFTLHPTVLSGDIGTPSVVSDNSFHVVTGMNLSSSTVFDGFEVANGYASVNFTDGAGIQLWTSDVKLRNCIIRDCAARNGGGISVRAGSSPLIYNCEIKNNQCTNRGGGLFNRLSDPRVVNCIIRNNLTQTDGGGVENSNAQPVFINTIFLSNTSFINGGGMRNDTSAAVILNCSFNNNTCFSQGGGILNFDSAPLIVNSIFYGDSPGFGQEIDDFASPSVVRNCIVQNGYITPSGTGINIYNINPGFAGAFNLRLDSLAAAKNLGDEAFVALDSMDVDEDGDSTEVIPDLDGNDRLRLCGLDLGAYEYQGYHVLYVDSSATGGNGTGDSWSNAFLDLKEAFSLAFLTDSILIAEGTFFADPNMTNRDSAFKFNSCTAVYGGWPVGGGTFSDRDYSTHLTILSGDINVDSVNTDNSYNVADASGVDSTCIVDGLVFRYGYADGSSGFNNNKGGGLIVDSGDPIFQHCTFQDNESAINGGAVAVLNGGTPTFVSCLFQGNTSASGGALSADASSPQLLNCTIYGNTATILNKPGGVLGTFGSNISLLNCLMWENQIPILDEPPSVTTASHSLIEGGWPGTGNLSVSPIFVNEPFDLHLKVCSPAVDAGDTTILPPGLDLDGNPRIINSGTDIGVYELQVVPVPAPTPVLGADTSFCLPDGLTLSADPDTVYPNSTFQWLLPNGSTPITVDVLADTTGEYIVELIDTNGCVGNDTISLVAFAEPTPDLGPEDTLVCASDLLPLSPGVFSAYDWSSGDSTATVSINTLGTVSVIVTDSNGCQATDSMVIQHRPTPNPTLNAPDSNVVCRNTTTILEVVETFPGYMWSTGAFSQSIAVDTGDIYFHVTVTDTAGCQGTDSIYVNYLSAVAGPSTVITTIGTPVFCNRDSVTLQAGAGFFSYRWFPTGETNPNIVVKTPGEYWAIITNGFGCVGYSDTVVTDVLPRPDVSLSLSNDTLFSSLANTYQWNLNGTPLAGETQRFVYLPNHGSGSYSVTVTDSTGCDSTSNEFPWLVGIEEPGVLGGIHVYPNPNQGTLYVSSMEGIVDPLQVKVTSMVGQEIKEFSFANLFEPEKLSLEELPAGIYLIRVSSGDRSSLHKIIKN